jgi:MFS family permease
VREMWALFLGLGLLMIGNGLNGAVIGVRSGVEGFSVVVTGVIMAGFFAGFLLAPTLVVRMIASVGHIRVFAGLASTASTAVLVHSLSVNAPTWVLMRFVFGFCFAGLYIVIESWLSEVSDSQNRGRTLAVYMIVSMSGLGIGQYLIALADPSTFRLFVLSSVLVSMALVPITLAGTTKAPQIRLPHPVPIRELTRVVPSGVIGSFMSGAAAGTLLGLSVVYATTVGFSIERTALFLLAPTVGGVVMQWPVGKLSDRLRRRVVILGVSVVAAVACALGVVTPSDNPVVLLIMFTIGGTMYPLYSLVVSYTLDWVAVERTVGASGTLVRLNGTGALVGPLLTAALMSWISPTFFYWALGSYFSVIVGFISYRILFREGLPKERERAYVPFPARATSVAFKLVTAPKRVTKRVGKNVATRRHEHRMADNRFDEWLDTSQHDERCRSIDG